jgi:hypothetical protein
MEQTTGGNVLLVGLGGIRKADAAGVAITLPSNGQ